MTSLRTRDLTQNDKKERERLLLVELASAQSDFPSGALDDFERPDFVLSTDDGEVIGIELVRYFRGQTTGQGGSIDLKDEKDHESVVRKAQTMFEAETNVSLQVSLLWYPGRHLHKSSLMELSIDLTELVRKNLPRRLLELVEVPRSQIAGTQLRRYVADILVVKLREGASSLWSSGESTWPEVSVGEIQGVLDPKNRDVQEYRQHVLRVYGRCSAIWLVVVAEGRYAASLVHLPDEVTGHRFRTPFERVLFWDRLGQTTVALLQST